MIFWIFAALAVLGVLFVASRARAYSRLFSDEHFVEVGRAAVALKEAANSRIIVVDSDAPAVHDDPRIARTAAGLTVVYTVKKRDSEIVHHCSVSAAGGVTAHAVGSTFVLFLVELLGLPVEKTVFEVGKTTVHHAECTIDEAEHDRIRSLPVPEVSAANVAELRQNVLERRASVTWRTAWSSA